MAYIYRLEQLDDPFVNKVNYGPWRGKDGIAGWAVTNNFDRYLDDKSQIYFRAPEHHGVEMDLFDVCGVREYKQLNDWFPNRFKRREPYRVVKYYVPDNALIDLPNQVVTNAKRLKQVAVLELFG